MAKTTKRQKYEEIIDILLDYKDTEDLVAFCDNDIALLDKKAALSSKSQEKKRTEKAETAERLLTFLSPGIFYTKEEAAALYSEEELTPCQARYLLQLLVKEGRLDVFQEEMDRYENSGKRQYRTLYAVAGTVEEDKLE